MISSLSSLVLPGSEAASNLLLFLTPSTLGKYAIFPVIDATLNGASAVLLFVGRGFILRGRMAAHRACMIAAVITSSLFNLVRLLSLARGLGALSETRLGTGRVPHD